VFVSLHNSTLPEAADAIKEHARVHKTCTPKSVLDVAYLKYLAGDGPKPACVLLPDKTDARITVL